MNSLVLGAASGITGAYFLEDWKKGGYLACPTVASAVFALYLAKSNLFKKIPLVTIYRQAAFTTFALFALSYALFITFHRLNEREKHRLISLMLCHVIVLGFLDMHVMHNLKAFEAAAEKVKNKLERLAQKINGVGQDYAVEKRHYLGLLTLYRDKFFALSQLSRSLRDERLKQLDQQLNEIEKRTRSL